MRDCSCIVGARYCEGYVLYAVGPHRQTRAGIVCSACRKNDVIAWVERVTCTCMRRTHTTVNQCCNSGAARRAGGTPPPEIGFTRKFLAARLS